MEGKARLSKVIAPYISMFPRAFQSPAHNHWPIEPLSMLKLDLREYREPAIEMPADAGETIDDEGFPGYEALDDYDSFAATQRDPLPTSGQDTIVNETALLSSSGSDHSESCPGDSLDLVGIR